MGLDPDSAALVARLRELDLPRYETLTPEQARAAMAAARKAAAVEPPPIGSTLEREIATGNGPIRLRLYRPAGASGVLPGLVFFHGGGWVLGDLETHDILCRRLATASGSLVVAVDYRRAPENRFPAAVEDALAATRWVLSHAAELGTDAARVGLGGDSAGANLAAVAALSARDRGWPAPAFQLLIYPVVDLAFTHPSHRLEGEGLPVLHPTMVWFRDHYLREAAQRDDWRASPLRAASFAALPPAYVLTAGYDPLADEGADYARRLEDAGNSVVHRHYPGQIHGFLTMGPNFPTTIAAVDEIGRWLARMVDRR